jgi:2-oxoglutarate ferredoxin oxidoreductase subunit beta
MKAKKAIRTAFETQQNRLGFSLIEVLAICPTNWGLAPQESLQWVKDQMIPVFPLGVYKNKSAVDK